MESPQQRSLQNVELSAFRNQPLFHLQSSLIRKLHGVFFLVFTKDATFSTFLNIRASVLLNLIQIAFVLYSTHSQSIWRPHNSKQFNNHCLVEHILLRTLPSFIKYYILDDITLWMWHYVLHSFLSIGLFLFFLFFFLFSFPIKFSILCPLFIISRLCSVLIKFWLSYIYSVWGIESDNNKHIYMISINASMTLQLAFWQKLWGEFNIFFCQNFMRFVVTAWVYTHRVFR